MGLKLSRDVRPFEIVAFSCQILLITLAAITATINLMLLERTRQIEKDVRTQTAESIRRHNQGQHGEGGDGA
jgi:hypothetical protein